jgi:transposase-like protein
MTPIKFSKKSTCPKKVYQKVSFDLKLTIIDKINNGQISLNHASEVYNISRSSINYWMEKLSTFAQMKKGLSKNQELKRLRERNQELEFIKDLQQDIIVDFERVTGEELSKKLLPEALAKEIAKKKKSLSK